MTRGCLCACLATSATFLLAGLAAGDDFRISGGLDVRAQAGDTHDQFLELHGAFLNARGVFSDELGDRWIVVAQADADSNFEQVRPYQLYLQYKGPLGRWNVRAGHYLLPFGLLAEYDTERLVLNGIEEKNMGIKLDTGIEALGYAGGWDWAVSASRGVGRRWPNDAETNYLVTARVARGGDQWRAGISSLVGIVRTAPPFPATTASTRERKGAVDLTYQRDGWTFRSEFSGGVEDREDVYGAVVLTSYSVRSWWDLDGKYAVLARARTEHTLGAGASLRLGKGWVLRPTTLIEFTPEETDREFIAQLYYDFSKSL